MGVKFAREYEDIVEELARAIGEIDDCYHFFEMTEADWTDLEEDEQKECLKTLADDVFFGLGTDPKIDIGQGILVYDLKRHVITVNHGDNRTTIVNLI